MGPYVISLFTGVLAGVIYSVIRVRSPAPPIIALVGLLGMVIGAQLIPMSHQLFAAADTARASPTSSAPVQRNSDRLASRMDASTRTAS